MATSQLDFCPELLSSLRDELGTLSGITRIVKLLGMVDSDSNFSRKPEVVNGASDFLTEVFGELGVHARSAVGMGALPLGIPVEIETVVEVSSQARVTTLGEPFDSPIE